MGVICCANKNRSGCFDFFSGIEEKAFSYLGELIGVYFNNYMLLKGYQEAEEAREIYLQTLRHEIIGPLDIIQSDSEWLADRLTKESPNYESRLRPIRSRIHENVQIIAMLARGSNALDSALTLNLESINLTETVIKPIVRFFEKESERTGIQVELDFLGIPRVVADPTYTMMVFYNVIRNACKYSDQKESERKIKIRSREYKDPEYVGIVVSDNGIGIDDQDANGIFDKYYRGSNAKALNVTGSGLGLAIARNIMDKQGGAIFLGNKCKPTEFVIDFRAARYP